MLCRRGFRGALCRLGSCHDTTGLSDLQLLLGVSAITYSRAVHTLPNDTLLTQALGPSGEEVVGSCSGQGLVQGDHR